MLIVDAVLETPDTADFTFWPVAGLPPYRFMTLSDRMPHPEVGTALALLTSYNAQADDDDRPTTDADGTIRRLLDTEKILAPGGLRLHDTGTDVTVTPGCCCGLEDWREWLDIADGGSPWFGHDPSPRLEHAQGTVRIWPDGRDLREAPPGRPVEIVLSDLPEILRTVRRRLQGFLSLTEQWAARHVPSLAADLVARLDKDLAVGAPLRTPLADT